MLNCQQLGTTAIEKGSTRRDAPGSQIDRAHLGLTLRKVRSGDYRLNFPDADENTAYYTDNLEDAIHAAAASRDAVPKSERSTISRA